MRSMTDAEIQSKQIYEACKERILMIGDPGAGMLGHAAASMACSLQVGLLVVITTDSEGVITSFRRRQ